MCLLGTIKSTVERFNSLLPYAAGDLIVSQVFKQNPTTGEERPTLLSMRMETINSVFQGGLRLKPTYRHGIVKGSFCQYYWQLVGDTKAAVELSEDTKDAINGIYNRTLSEPRGALETSSYQGPRKLFPTFVSKLLHWTFPRGFPMQDNFSMNTMREVAKNNMFSFTKSYDSVIRFYVQLEKKLEGSNDFDVKEKLEKFDYESQPEGLKERYSWIRVIDKWLWLGEQSE